MRLRRSVVAIALAGLAAAAAHAERVARFEVDVFLSASERFAVEERITYDFGAEQRHGIERWIPIAYGRGRAADYRIALDVQSVTDASGAELPVTERRDGRNLVLRIGDPNVLVSGVREYRVRYAVRRGFLYLEQHDELYWNATGTEWEVPIEGAGARVYLPSGLAPEKVDALCFTGPQGAVQSDCAIERGAGSVAFTASRALGAREGLTLALALPKGVLPVPSRRAQWLDRASDFVTPWFLLPLGTLGTMIYLWRSRGRDLESGRGAIAVRYEPPPGLTPAEVGTLLDESADLSDLTATIVDLAVHGFLRIEEQESHSFLFFSSRDYALVKLCEPDERKPHERQLMSALFSSGTRVSVSALRNRFYVHLPGIQQALYSELSRADGFFSGNPQSTRRVWVVGGALLAGLGLGVASAPGWLGAGVSLVLSGGVVIAFSRAMPRRTRRGRQALEETLGLREFLERVEADRLEREGARTRERFEAILPYAIVLGCADAWAGAFADIYTEPPSWYASPRYGRGFTPRAFVSDMGQGLGTIGQAMTSAPRSSGSGRSGFGGGGFSGGGFGGGGGRSW